MRIYLFLKNNIYMWIFAHKRHRNDNHGNWILLFINRNGYSTGSTGQCAMQLLVSPPIWREGITSRNEGIVHSPCPLSHGLCWGCKLVPVVMVAFLWCGYSHWNQTPQCPFTYMPLNSFTCQQLLVNYSAGFFFV